MERLVKTAKEAAYGLYQLSDEQLRRLLLVICQKLSDCQEDILRQNQRDRQRAALGGLSGLRLQRLALTPAAFQDTLGQLRQLADQRGLVNVCTREWALPGNMTAAQKRVPIGAIAAVFECRPTAVLEIMALCLRTGNSCILRSGGEMRETARAMVSAAQAGLLECGLPAHSVQLAEDPSQEALCALMKCQGLDLLLARGSQRLISLVQETARVPWLCLGPGNCHVYVDAAAKAEMAAEIISTSKAQPLLCNSLETALIHRDLASEFLPPLAERLHREGITLRGCGESCRLSPWIQPAEETDYAAEANDFILTVKIVADLEEAAQHIRRYGSDHSEVIVTEDTAAAERFIQVVDAGAVYVNASSRFTDGVSLGLGMEAGISTQKLHTRGPVTVEAFTTLKYIVRGCGNVR